MRSFRRMSCLQHLPQEGVVPSEGIAPFAFVCSTAFVAVSNGHSGRGDLDAAGLRPLFDEARLTQVSKQRSDPRAHGLFAALWQQWRKMADRKAVGMVGAPDA